MVYFLQLLIITNKANGCPKCGRIRTHQKKTRSHEENIIDFRKIHGNKYEYPEETKKLTVKFNILCKIHGLFLMTPQAHINGQGCPKCGRLKLAETQSKSFEENKRDFRKVHGNQYLYKESTKRNNQLFTVTCTIHGDFKITPGNHKQGQGCKKCANENREGGWSFNHWKKHAETSNRFDSFKVYIIECFDENEKFIKIGRTYSKINQRFNSSLKMPYSFRVLKEVIFEDPKKCWKYEKELHSIFKKLKYKPLKYFGGHQECFTLEVSTNITFVPNDYGNILVREN